ncbi:hypothetical protein [Roseinatronobacter sp. NSM]|uniref:hypothetical protein n=1 Tax=Roseinatronobacter sp. NSM TaxID=3457785 RepID=UPI004036A2FE
MVWVLLWSLGYCADRVVLIQLNSSLCQLSTEHHQADRSRFVFSWGAGDMVLDRLAGVVGVLDQQEGMPFSRWPVQLIWKAKIVKQSRAVDVALIAAHFRD